MNKKNKYKEIRRKLDRINFIFTYIVGRALASIFDFTPTEIFSINTVIHLGVSLAIFITIEVFIRVYINKLIEKDKKLIE